MIFLFLSTYTLPSLDELMLRFEEPTPEARWHRPLFTTTSVGSADHPECLPTPLDAIWDAMTLARVQPPKAVTAVVRIIAYDFVRHLGHSFPSPTNIDKSGKKRPTIAWNFSIPSHRAYCRRSLSTVPTEAHWQAVFRCSSPRPFHRLPSCSSAHHYICFLRLHGYKRCGVSLCACTQARLKSPIVLT